MTRIAERARRILSVKEFEQTCHPEPVGTVYVEGPKEDVRILRMQIDPSNLPSVVKWARPIVAAALHYQLCIVGVKHPFCYITIRHGEHFSETDDEWHVDGFSTQISHLPEQNYVWSNVDCTEFPASFRVRVPYTFNPNVHNLQTLIQRQIRKDAPVVSGVPCVIYCMDPYVVHRKPRLPVFHRRSFVRVSFTPIIINDKNNTPNPLGEPYTPPKDGVAFRNSLKTWKE